MDGSHWIDFNSPDYIFKDGNSNQGTPSPGHHHHLDQNALQQSINQENINQQVILNENQSSNPNQQSDQATEYYLQNLQKWTTLDLISDNIIASPSNSQNNPNGDSRDPVNNIVINGNSLHNNENKDSVSQASTTGVVHNQADQASLTSYHNNDSVQEQFNNNNNIKPSKFPHQNLTNGNVQNSFPKYLNNVQNKNTGAIDSTHSSKYFTPLISPAMTPLESIIHPTPNVTSHDPFNTSDLTQGFFTPLTSPAINPVSNNPSPGSFFTINDFNMANAVAATMNGTAGPSSTTSNNTRHKKSISSSTANSRRTSKNYSGRILKQTVTTTSKNSRNNSPVIKAEMAQRHQNLAADTVSKDSSLFMDNNNKNNSYSIDLNDLAEFTLPGNAQSNEYLFINSERKLYAESSSSLNNSSTSLHSITNTTTGLNENVQVKDTVITDSTTLDVNSQQQQHPVTPATLMNLKNKSKPSVKRRTSSNSVSLNSNSSSSRSGASGKEKLSIREITFQTTPSITSSTKASTSSSLKNSPTSTPQTESQKQSQSVLHKTVAFSSFKTYKSKAAAAGTGNKKSIMDSVIAHQSQFKLNLPPSNNSAKNDINTDYKLTMDNDKNSKKVKEGTAKKSSHREAEKGRRDRMNIAIHDLALLLPEYLTSTVAVPSKATTVELASMYIKSLINQLEAAKNENIELKQKYNIQ